MLGEAARIDRQTEARGLVRGITSMTSITAAHASTAHKSPAYQTMLVGLLGLNMGFVFLDRNAFGLLAPMIQPEFSLSNTQVGMITGILAVTWSVSSFGLNR